MIISFSFLFPHSSPYHVAGLQPFQCPNPSTLSCITASVMKPPFEWFCQDSPYEIPNTVYTTDFALGYIPEIGITPLLLKTLHTLDSVDLEDLRWM